MALIDLDDDDDSVYAQTESDDEQRYASVEDEGYRPRKQNYTVLTENDIRQRQNDDISHVSSVLSISTSEATTLLCHYGWKISKLHDDWFADEETVRTKVGLGFGPTSGYGSSSPPSLCQICFEDYPPSEILTTSVCAHPYCLTCWRSYVMMAIDDSGSGCLLLKCPDPKCHAAVGLGLIKKLELGGKYESKYGDFLVRSYVEGRRGTIKWCPAPGCENAVEFVLGSGDVYDVMCSCTNAFCWNCGEEAHRPVDCRTVAEWIKKNSSESENTNWILAYSKPCPKCKRPIEKNNGCNHMTCRPPCGHHFCWLCLEDLRKQHYSCNRYENARKDKWKNEDERRRELAKQSLERYTHYYERWASNHKSRLKAIEDLNKMKANDLKMLSDKVKQPEVLLGFIMGAWQQIIECRRVLKWTYAYGFYLPEKEHAKRQLFEYSQGEAETNLERLHQCVERELTEKFIQADECSPGEADFNEFRCKLTGLTKVTCSYFEKLVSALENGLSEVDSQADKKPKAKKRKAAVTVSSGSSSSTSMVAAEVAMTIRPAGVVDLNVGSWNCDRCTYLNPDSARSCQMCFDSL